VAVDTKNSIVITKVGAYRGGTREWSNRYHFEGAVATDAAAWEAFADLIVAAEKACFDSTTEIIRAQGCDVATATETNPHGDAVWEKAYTTVGTFVPNVADIGTPGDCCVLVRYSTDARSVKNHPIYLFNYYHAAWNRAASGDALAADSKTAYETYADEWLAGFSLDGSARERCGPRGAVAVSRYVHPYIRHRDFPS
jgi:hypothetical protein